VAPLPASDQRKCRRFAALIAPCDAASLAMIAHTFRTTKLHRMPDTAPVDVPAYGVREREPAGDDAALHAEELRRDGYTVLPGVFDEATMRRNALRLDELLVQQTAECGGPDVLQRARDADLVRCPLAYDDALLQLACDARVLAVAQRLLGDNVVLLMQNAVVNRPQLEQAQSRYHRDLNYQHWTSSRPLALNFLVCVDRFYVEGGATWVLPGSHRYEVFPSPRYVARHEVPVEAEAGAVVMMDAMLFHRSGHNRSADHVRRAVNHVVGTPFMAQQIDMPRLLQQRGRDHSADPFLARYLGYRWNPAPDVTSWRQQHARAH
jgi:ectoine hydroxylase-related dioxygenase (phytanoyl-CoA dioxygenase family)